MASLYVFDGMKRPAFTVEIDVAHSTVADLFCSIAERYDLDFNPRRNLRIVFVDKELKYTQRKKLCDVGIINNSTVAVIFQLPDRHPTAPATTEDDDVLESVEVKIDGEENKDMGNLYVTESALAKARMKSKKKKRRNAKGGPVLENADKENNDANNDVATAESDQVKTDEENEDANDVATAESDQVKTGEENEDANDVSTAESDQVKTDEENKDANDFSTADFEPAKADEEIRDAVIDLSAAEFANRKEENKDEVTVAESEAVSKGDDDKYEKEISINKSEPVKADEEEKDTINVSAARKAGVAVPILKETVVGKSENTSNATVSVTKVSNVTAEISAVGKAEEEEKRPKLQRLPEIVELVFLPDFLNFDMTEERAMLPCCHVMGSDTMRLYCEKLVENGHTEFACPYLVFPFSIKCPVVLSYKLVRHVACFTPMEMHDTEKAIAINFVGKDYTTLACPGCFTWCSKVDSKMTRLRCFLCTKETGKEFLFCGYCLQEWKNARCGRCANRECQSIERTLDILRNSPVTQLYGGTWPTIRLCPRCGILTEFMGQCSQIHCQLCGYNYCFLCLKGAKSKAALQCIPYNSPCQRASLQTSIPQWDGNDSD